MVIPNQIYTVRGLVALDPSWPVEAVGTALMDCAAEVDAECAHDIAVSLDLDRSEIELECVVSGRDQSDALANASIIFHEVCTCAKLPVELAEEEKPCPRAWSVEAPDTSMASA